MLLVGSSLKGYAIEGSDGRLASVSDFLFDDRTWKVRRLVVPPSAIGRADYEAGELSVRLTKQLIEGSPDIEQDQPVSRQMQDNLYG